MTILKLANIYKKKADAILYKNKSKFLYRSQWSIEDKVKLKVLQEVYKDLSNIRL